MSNEYLQEEIDNLNSQVEELQSELDNANDEIAVLQDDLDGATEREEEARIAGYQEALEDVHKAVKNLE